MLAAVAAFIGMMLSIRDLSGTLSVSQILLMRCVVGLPLLLVLIPALYGPSGFVRIRTANLKLQLFRNLMHFIGQMCWIFGIAVLPLATILAIEYSTPLWAVLFGALVLAEYPSRAQKIALAVGFCAVLAIVRPGIGDISVEMLIVVAGAASYAAAHMTTRVLGRTDDSLAVVFWMNLLQMPFALGWAVFDWNPIPDAAWPMILLMGASGVLAHQFMSKSLAMAPLSVVMPIDYLRLPLVAAVGTLFYGEPLDPVIIGSAIVLIGAVLLAQRR
jgi:drug/metabolite transporter (DMT)-like permease